MAPKNLKWAEIKGWKNKAFSGRMNRGCFWEFPAGSNSTTHDAAVTLAEPQPWCLPKQTTYVSSVIPQPCNLTICVWQHSQLCFQKEDQIPGMSKLVGVKQTCSYRDSEMRNQSQQVTGNGAVGPREEELNCSQTLPAMGIANRDHTALPTNACHKHSLVNRGIQASVSLAFC